MSGREENWGNAGARDARTHPLTSFRSALTTSLTPRFTCLCLEAAGRRGRGGVVRAVAGRWRESAARD